MCKSASFYDHSPWMPSKIFIPLGIGQITQSIEVFLLILLLVFLFHSGSRSMVMSSVMLSMFSKLLGSPIHEGPFVLPDDVLLLLGLLLLNIQSQEQAGKARGLLTDEIGWYGP